MMHLLSLATTSGLKLQTHTLITTISHSLSSPRKWTATTPRGTITATKIIFATNGYVSGLLPEYTSKIVPTRGTAFRIITPPNSKHPEIKYSYSLRLPNGAGEYLHARPDGSIIGGGACAHFFPNPKSWYNVVDDSSLTDAPATYVFDNYMQEHFIGWEDSSVKVDGIWTGIMGYTSDVLPSVGEVPGRKGCYVAAGFDEHGMPVIYLTMKGIAEIVLKDRVLEEVGIPRIYKTTRERLESEDDLLKPKDWEEVKP
jgi:glycine/D-amino acid oxidase-like deaminating enzyme